MRTYTKQEIAELIDRSTKTVERMVKDGRLPKPLPLHRYFQNWDADAVDELLRANGIDVPVIDQIAN